MWCSEQQVLEIVLTEREMEWMRAKDLNVLTPVLARHADNIFSPYVPGWYKPLQTQTDIRTLTGKIIVQIMCFQPHRHRKLLWTVVALPFVKERHIWIPHLVGTHIEIGIEYGVQK